MSRICRRDMDPPGYPLPHGHNVTFGERPLFTATFGTAGRPAKGQNVSGDALIAFAIPAAAPNCCCMRRHGHRRAAAVDGQMAAA